MRSNYLVLTCDLYLALQIPARRSPTDSPPRQVAKVWFTNAEVNNVDEER